MLPLLLLLLIQGLYAAQFPDLTKSIHLTWDGIDIPVLDGSQTASINGKVPYFTMCGAFNTEQKDLYCTANYSSSLKTGSSSTSSSGSWYGDAKFLYRGYNGTCMTFANPIPENFIEIYNGIPSGRGSYDLTYNCSKGYSSSKIFAFFGVGFLIILGCCCTCGFCAFRTHQSMKSKEIVQQNTIITSYTTNNVDFYSLNGMNNYPGYTAPPGNNIQYNAGNPVAYASGNPAPYVPPAAYDTGHPGYGVGNPGYGVGNTGYGAYQPTNGQYGGPL